MVIKDLLMEGIKVLELNPSINSQLEVRLILSKIMEVDKSYLYAYTDRSVDVNIANEFIEMVNRRSKGYPLQYLLGVQEFMGMEFLIKEGVLIPRGDTEVLVQYLIDYINKRFVSKEFSILDIGVGSGAISLAIANYCPNGNVFGVDINKEAIDLALQNMKRFGLNNVKYYYGDLFSPFIKGKDKFDIIVSNPPYIPTSDRESLQVEVKDFEPETALFGGEDGLDFYRMISKKALDYLKDDSLLAYEVGFNQGKDVKDIMEKCGYESIEVIKDLEERDRVVVGTLKRRE